MRRNLCTAPRLKIQRVTLIACLLLSGWQVVFSKSLYWYEIQTDDKGKIIPWYSPDHGESYDHVINLVFDFWTSMRRCPNGVPYYMQHQVWVPGPGCDYHRGVGVPDCGYMRGLGGDQVNMALSSWNLLYAYSGKKEVLDNMIYMADYFIENGLSGAIDLWPNVPYTYNTDIHSGVYDGDMRAEDPKGVIQPDKAGSFGAELVVLYKITGQKKYLDVAKGIADTLAAKVAPGDGDKSPWPFKVNAKTGEAHSPYTANWTPTLRLFDELIGLKHGNVAAYASAHRMVSAWLKKYPMETNKWGPFFEDIKGWSDTAINAGTCAHYIMDNPDNPQWSATWKGDVKSILDWVNEKFGSQFYRQYGVNAINEQTAFRVPGQSHTSRQGSLELMYCDLTGDSELKDGAIRKLNWSTYAVDPDGKNYYISAALWLTDGYGDFVRHFLRSMGAAPELGPAKQDHLLRTTSVIKSIAYSDASISYSTFDDASRERLRVSFEPVAVTAGDTALVRLKSIAELDSTRGYTFEAAGDASGVLRIRHDNSGDIVIAGNRGPADDATPARDQQDGYTDELLKNPGFEDRIGDEWVKTGAGGPLTRVPRLGMAKHPVEGEHFCAIEGKVDSESGCYQDVDLTPWQNDIVAGNARIHCRAWIISSHPKAENGRLRVMFYDAADEEIEESTYDTGCIAKNRPGKCEYPKKRWFWVPVGVAHYTVPADAAKVRLWNQFTSKQGVGAGGIDAASCKLLTTR